ncbi:M24 family metallopeptidase [Desulfonatronovibrio hydrogenovorans]|uniref:M24 family metallopeptidase n=1 Tax=Desulfonatronovibrio hydrogenovorans TaxID=53245 RepID=UPI00048B7F4C|nr:Xaa-Pro peptidase family protein [Desulfonatronovibrio hydrogenovorans]
MFESLERLPALEMEKRLVSFRSRVVEAGIDCDAVLIFSRLNIYYFTGSLGNGVLWIPMDDDPVFMCRKGMERFKLESPVRRIAPFRSYGDIPGILSEFGQSFPQVIGVEKTGINWALADNLKKRLSGIEFVPVDQAISRTRMVKTGWEADKILICGKRHHEALYGVLPELIYPGMTEREISIKIWDCFFSLGHQGMMRMQNYGEEVFLGHVSAGDSANYPSVFNGPVGLRGEHPAITQMGYSGRVWQDKDPLTVDCGFALEGYVTDKTQVYFPAAARVPDSVQKAHDLCIEIQARAAEQLRPGVLAEEIYEKALAKAKKAGFADGFMGLDGNQVPFLGHGIGLAVDEYPPLARGFKEPLQNNMFLALEPKIGIRGVGMVGVENTFQVSDGGGVCVTGDAFDMVRV